MYIMIKKTLTERIEEAKKKNLLTLLDLLDILINKKGTILCQKLNNGHIGT